MRYLMLLPVVIMLTSPDGQPIWIETEHVQTARPSGTSCEARAKTIIKFEAGATLCVRETPQEVSERANQARKK